MIKTINLALILTAISFETAVLLLLVAGTSLADKAILLRNIWSFMLFAIVKDVIKYLLTTV